MSTTATDKNRDLTERDAISCDNDVVSGTPVFKGTRVPAATLFDYLLNGHSLQEFYDDFPTVTPEHVQGVLWSAREHVNRRVFPSREAGLRDSGL